MLHRWMLMMKEGTGSTCYVDHINTNLKNKEVTQLLYIITKYLQAYKLQQQYHYDCRLVTWARCSTDPGVRAVSVAPTPAGSALAPPPTWLSGECWTREVSTEFRGSFQNIWRIGDGKHQTSYEHYCVTTFL